MIIGAGLAGLVAAHVFPAQPIIDAASGPLEQHKALLRMRSSAVSDLTGIPFRRVTVNKGIWFEGAFHQPNPRVCNLYAKKVLGIVADRSIWDISSVTRWIPPEDFYAQLIDAVGNRIQWGTRFVGSQQGPDSVVSTIPLPVMLKTLGIKQQIRFNSTPIEVCRFRLSIPSSVHQTIYFPCQNNAIYRASLADQILTCECTGKFIGEDLRDVLRAFGLEHELMPLDDAHQQLGKLEAIDNDARRALVFQITNEYGIYSLGRFATWRNILLDDVVNDAHVIKRMIGASAYTRKLHYANQ